VSRPIPLELNTASDQSTDLIGWWPFASGALEDFSGNGHGQSSVDIATAYDSDFGTVGVFNGTSSFITLNGPVVLPIAWTFAAWVKTTYWAAHADTRGRLMATGRDAGNKFSYFFEPIRLTFGVRQGKRFRSVLTDDGSTGWHTYVGPESPFEYDDSTWYHWACTRDGNAASSRAKHYINGDLVASSSPNVLASSLNVLDMWLPPHSNLE